MKEHLSLVELAAYGYAPARVKKGSWLEQKFGTKSKEVEDSGCIGRSDKNKDEQTGR